MIGGYPPKANVNNRAEVIVLIRLKDVCFEQMMRDKITIAFQLKQGITRKEKYMNDRIYGVTVLNKANSI